MLKDYALYMGLLYRWVQRNDEVKLMSSDGRIVSVNTPRSVVFSGVEFDRDRVLLRFLGCSHPVIVSASLFHETIVGLGAVRENHEEEMWNWLSDDEKLEVIQRVLDRSWERDEKGDWVLAEEVVGEILNVFQNRLLGPSERVRVAFRLRELVLEDIQSRLSEAREGESKARERLSVTTEAVEYFRELIKSLQ